VVAAGNADEALEALREGRFDLLITDVAMPDVDGLELVRMARAIDGRLPVLFSSGYADVQTFGEELSDETVLRKPFRIADVAARIETVLDRSMECEAELG
jgi:DNA-binding response OmpR family regulator